MNNPEFIRIDNFIIRLDEIVSITVETSSGNIYVSLTNAHTLHIETNNAQKVLDWFKGDWIAIFDDSDDTPPPRIIKPGPDDAIDQIFRNASQATMDNFKRDVRAVMSSVGIETPPQSDDNINPAWTEMTVTAIEHKNSSSGNPTWYLTLKGINRTHYIRQSNKDIWIEHYPQLEDMQIGDYTDDVDITIYTLPQSDNSDFMTTMKVMPGGTLKLPEISASDLRKMEVATMLADYEKWTYLDLECTGILADDEILSYGIIGNLDTKDILFKESGWIKPMDISKIYRTGKSDQSAFDVHGIDATLLERKKATPFPDHYQKLRGYIHDKPLATYGEYDLNMLNQVCKMHHLDPIVPSRQINLMALIAKYIGEPGFKPGEYKWQKLEDACKTITGKELEDAHDALADTQALRDIVTTIVAKSTPADMPF